jgi:S-methylmethionine-dependent homocysteine/selenocysteine methylase
MRTALYCTLYYRRLGLISIVPRPLRMSTTSLAAVTTNNDNKNNNNSNNNTSSTSLRDTFQQLRNNPNQVFLLDGGTGEELFRHGVPDDRKLWSATALVQEGYHDALQQVHASFLQAGAQAITTNSYGVVPGVGFTPEERTKYIGVAGRIARQAVASHPTGGFVFGSLGPLVESYRPDKIQEHSQGVADYTLACQAMYQEQNIPHPQQVDAFLAETMSCVAESAQAVEAVASSLADPPPMLVSYTLDPKGNLRDGQDVTAGVRQLLDIVKDQHKVECKYSTKAKLGYSTVQYSKAQYRNHTRGGLYSLLFG